ncbi:MULTISPECIES: aromatic acid exporter family protein [Paenibacillus]|uniref:FUSC family protein n=1 Tax=Paenibacillus agri TaxID=2744309 RepID=A0A850EL27_9BACL|nr:FUSC family protein [Paenibacillus agri]NUU60197.1 FUSC family protein [Paenibacillus agri]
MNEGLFDRLEKFGFSLYMIRITLAASLSWVVVHSLYSNHYLYFAPLAAILITQGTVKGSVEKGIYRLLGIILGGIVALIVGKFFNISGLSILLMLLIGIGIATACRVNIQAVTQVGVTSVMALSFYQNDYVVSRITETFIGVLIAILINMIIVPPKGFVKVKALALEGSQLLAEALRGLAAGEQSTEKSNAVSKQAGELLKRSGKKQKEIHYTLSHYQCRNELNRLSTVTSHLKTVHAYVKEIIDEIALLPPHYAAAEGMAGSLEATADCIALYGTETLSDTERPRSLPDALHHARELQLSCFSQLQSHCPLTAMRDLGAVFSHLNRVLDEVERAEYATCSAVPHEAKRDIAQGIHYMKKGLSHKL